MNPDDKKERALLAYLGDERFRRFRSIALRRSARKAVDVPEGNVIVLPGIMGSELSTVSKNGTDEPLWASIFRIMRGALKYLRLSTGKSQS